MIRVLIVLDSAIITLIKLTDKDTSIISLNVIIRGVISSV